MGYFNVPTVDAIPYLGKLSTNWMQPNNAINSLIDQQIDTPIPLEHSSWISKVSSAFMSYDEFQCCKEEWQTLLKRSNADPLFMSWHWQFAWWQTWGELLGLDLKVFKFWHDDVLIGIIPMCLDKQSSFPGIKRPRLQFIGNRWRTTPTVRTEYVGPIFDADYEQNFDTVWKHIGTREPCGMFEQDNVYVTEYPGHTKMYEAVTQYCGFPAIEAGKLMGLSPYGKENDELPSFFDATGEWGNRELIIPTYPNAAQLNYARYDILKDDVTRHKEGDFTEVQKDLAYKIQKETSERMVTLIRRAHELTGKTNIVICGGYGLNCVANYKYWKEFPDLNIYCEPISHDGGTSIGGAKWIWHQLNETKKSSGKQESVYYGPQYDPSTYESDLGDLDVRDTSYGDIAQLIRDGNIVTIYQGRSEGGPRALGNRSILFDPTIKDGKDYVNTVKRREWFRPFACSIKKEAVHDWFDLAGREETPHMMYAVKCHDGVEEKIPSVIHVDNTCRIQTVTQEQNEHYYSLIDAFEKLSEVPILFNTSFNLGGEPLVETIEDAVKTLTNSDIEYLYLPEIQKLVYVPNE